jgi:outer membrane protein
MISRRTGNSWKMAAFLASLLMALGAGGGEIHAADIIVNLEQAPQGGKVVLLLFDSANAFGDFRDPVRSEPFEADGRTSFLLAEVPAGDYALLVHHDTNGNGVIDKNFIGIPTEPIAFSNGYRPKGPPSYQRARFTVGSSDDVEMDLELFQALGRRGRVGVGLGVIGRSSPYREYSGGVYQVIPAITYNGDRFQFLGPNLQVGVVGSGMLRLAAILSYRIGVYEEKDSLFLDGLGDRESTAMAGLAMEFELPRGIDLSLRYEHDILDRIGGGGARLGLDKAFSLGVVRIMPEVGVNWLSSDLSNHDFGVPPAAATLDRPAYELDDTISFEIGLASLIEISRDWLIVMNLAVERFDDEVTNSPIVVEDQVVKGFFALNYVF